MLREEPRTRRGERLGAVCGGRIHRSRLALRSLERREPHRRRHVSIEREHEHMRPHVLQEQVDDWQLNRAAQVDFKEEHAGRDLWRLRQCSDHQLADRTRLHRTVYQRHSRSQPVLMEGIMAHGVRIGCALVRDHAKPTLRLLEQEAPNSVFFRPLLADCQQRADVNDR